MTFTFIFFYPIHDIATIKNLVVYHSKYNKLCSNKHMFKIKKIELDLFFK